jgi:hypothetical protein
MPQKIYHRSLIWLIQNELHLLTPWCRIFEKLIVTQLVKNILLYLRNPKVQHRVHKCPPMDTTPSQTSPHRFLSPEVPFNVIIQPTPRSFRWSLPFRPPNQNPVNTFPLPRACHMSRPPHPHWFNHSMQKEWHLKFTVLHRTRTWFCHLCH